MWFVKVSQIKQGCGLTFRDNSKNSCLGTHVCKLQNQGFLINPNSRGSRGSWVAGFSLLEEKKLENFVKKKLGVKPSISFGMMMSSYELCLFIKAGVNYALFLKKLKNSEKNFEKKNFIFFSKKVFSKKISKFFFRRIFVFWMFLRFFFSNFFWMCSD